MSMTYLRSVLFPKQASHEKNRSSAIVSDKFKLSIKEFFAKENKVKFVEVTDNVTTPLLPIDAVIARTQKDLANLTVDPVITRTMQSVFNALHHPSLLDAPRGIRYRLQAPYYISAGKREAIKHGLMCTYAGTAGPLRQIATAQALQTRVPLLDTYAAAEQTSGTLDGDIMEVARILRLERAPGAHSSTIGEPSDGFQLDLDAVVTALSHLPPQDSRSSWGSFMSESLGTGGATPLASWERRKAPSFISNETRIVATADMKIIRFLGEGTTGKVYLAKDQISRAKVALKVVDKKGKSEYTIGTIVQECDLLDRLSASPWFVQLHSSWHDHDYMYIAMTPYPSDLDSELFRLVKMEPARARFYMAEIIIALTALHKFGIIHRDVKAANILIDREGHIVLADFGLSMDFFYPPSFAERVHQPYWPYYTHETADSNINERDPRELYYVAWDYRGSELEMAPEVHFGQPYSFGVDFWSAAVVLYWMLTGRPPWYEKEDCIDHSLEVDDKPLKFKIAEDDLVFLPSDDVDEVAQEFLQRMLEKDPRARLTIDREMPRHPYFAGVNWPLMKARKVPTPWVPGCGMYHVYEPSTPVFTPGKPYAEYEDPWPEFTHTSEQAMCLVDADYEDSESDIDEDSQGQIDSGSANMELPPDYEDFCGNVGPTPSNSLVGRSQEIAPWSVASGRGDSSPLCTTVDAYAAPETTSDATTEVSVSRDGSDTLPATPTRDSHCSGWEEVTIISPPLRAPHSSGHKHWLQPQDILRLRPKLPLTMASSTTSISALEVMCVPAYPPGLGASATSIARISQSFSSKSDSGDSSGIPQEAAPLGDSSGLLSKVRTWWMSQVWTHKPRPNMGVKRLSC